MANAQVTGTNRYDGMLGFMAISLSNMANQSAPAILAGSKVEINGAFFSVSSDESITGFAGFGPSTFLYIMLTPSGTPGSQTFSASYVTAAPTWDTAKQGWYAAGTSNRYIGGLYKDAGSVNYCTKFLYPTDQGSQSQLEMLQGGYTRPIIEVSSVLGDWNLASTQDAVDFRTNLKVLLGESATDSITRQVFSGSCFLRSDTGAYTIPVTLNVSSNNAGSSNPIFPIQGDVSAAAIAVCFNLVMENYSLYSNSRFILRRTLVSSPVTTHWDSTSYNRGWIYLRIRA
jgi:hypothetical protein